MTREALRAVWPCECQEIGTCIWCLMKVSIKREFGKHGFDAVLNLLTAERASEAEACAEYFKKECKIFSPCVEWCEARAAAWRKT